MGLPQILIQFQNTALSALKRSERGIVALIVKDDTSAIDSFEFTSLADVDATKFTADNYDYIVKTFLGSPAKVIVERLAANAANYSAALTRLKTKRFNWLAIPGIVTGDVATIVSWIKTERSDYNRFVKAVLPNVMADHESIVNFTTEGIVVDGTTYSASKYTCRIAGILAGLPFTRSATYYVLPEVDAITSSSTPGADIDAGKMILINDGSKIKIAAGVNSLTTLGGGKGVDMKDIMIIEKMDLNSEDIRTIFNDEYTGKILNTYDNKMLFIASIHAYFRNLMRDYTFFDPANDNKMIVDVLGNKTYLEGLGTDTSTMSEQDIKEANTGKTFYITGSVKYTNAAENLTLKIAM